ncbi:MAG: cell division protein ZapA [Sphingobacteriaceae bacterium]|nr:cell division protein ZapA [Sphingobacteriaceae bacterium]
MENKHLNIKIGDREYPVVVPASDEPRVREAEQLINTKLKEFKTLYPGADKTDHAAMTAFFLANALLSVDTSTQSNQLEVQVAIQELNTLLDGLNV